MSQAWIYPPAPPARLSSMTAAQIQAELQYAALQQSANRQAVQPAVIHQQRFFEHHPETKIIYYIPAEIGSVFDRHGDLLAAAKHKQVQMDVYVHFDLNQNRFRLGPLYDGDDCIETTAGALIHHVHAEKNGMDVQDAIAVAASQVTIYANSTSSAPSSSDQKNPNTEKVKKPRNCWILYRQDKHGEMAARYPDTHISLLSKLISAEWSKETAEVKGHYKKLATQEKLEHQLKYPTYKCAPRKSADIKRRKKKSITTVRIEGQLSPQQVTFNTIGFAALSDNNKSLQHNPVVFYPTEFNTKNMLATRGQVVGEAPADSVITFPGQQDPPQDDFSYEEVNFHDFDDSYRPWMYNHSFTRARFLPPRLPPPTLN